MQVKGREGNGRKEKECGTGAQLLPQNRRIDDGGRDCENVEVQLAKQRACLPAWEK